MALDRNQNEKVIPDWMSAFARQNFEKNSLTKYRNPRAGLVEPQFISDKGSDSFDFVADGFNGSVAPLREARAGIPSDSHYVEVAYVNEASGLKNSLLFESMPDAHSFVLANFSGPSLEMKRLDSLCDSLGCDLIQTPEFRGLGKDILASRTSDGLFDRENVSAQVGFVIDAVPCVMSDAFEKRFHGIRSYKDDLQKLIPEEQRLYGIRDPQKSFWGACVVADGRQMSMMSGLAAMKEDPVRDFIVTNDYMSARTLSQMSNQPVILAFTEAFKDSVAMEVTRVSVAEAREAFPGARPHFIAGIRKNEERDAFQAMAEHFGCKLRTPNLTLSEKGMGKDTVFDLKCSRGMEGVRKQFRDLVKERDNSMQKGMDR